MSVGINAHLSATPDPARLPANIVLSQNLTSSMPNDSVILHFELSFGHDVWFENNGAPAKAISFTDQIGVGTPVRHQVRLIRHIGTATSGIGIDELVISSDGLQTPDYCRLQVI